MKTDRFIEDRPGQGGHKAFTLTEIMVVVVIIALLLSILVPALSYVKRLAKETKQRAQIASIEMGINLYKNDFGEYPPSHGSDPNNPTFSYPYCGAQTLAEAMFGQDLLGFYPDFKYDIGDPCYVSDTLNARKDPYLDRTNISVFTPRQIFDKDTYPVPNCLVSDRYVICDVFTTVNRTLLVGGIQKAYKIGTPVLYFRANPSGLTELTPSPAGKPEEFAANIYNYRDDYYLMRLGKITDGKEHPLCPFTSDNAKAVDGSKFHGYIGDPMVPGLTRPVRPDSFLLISAGADGLYGTKDDICNFDPNLPS